MIRHKYIIIGVGTPRRRKILLLMQRLLGGRQGLSRVLLLGMGGRMHEVDAKDPIMKYLMKRVGSVWVESEGMVQKMKSIGINQTYLFPNCRTNKHSVEPRKCYSGKLKLVFFSRVCEEKGVDIIIDIINRLPQNCSLDFYGEVAEAFKKRFDSFLKTYTNIVYHGVFDATNGNVYQELNKYDVLLLPSRWKAEGVSGALVESKMAGITAIVSDWNYNREVVLDGKEGVVLKNTTSEELLSVIETLEKDRVRLMNLKSGAFESRNRYCIETYKKQLLNAVRSSN